MRPLHQNTRASRGETRAGHAGGATPTIPAPPAAYLRRPAPDELGRFANIRDGELVQGRASGSLGWAIVWGALGVLVIIALADKTIPQAAHDAAMPSHCFIEGC